MYYYYYNYFFGNNPENRIGFKKLTKADLGLSTSNQTHIGLLGDVFTFLEDEDVVKQAMLIYEDYCDILTCSFDRIENPDGSFRSPKIKTGTNRIDSVVGKIREFARQFPTSNWYLVWVGLESEELVFWLIKEDSQDFELAKRFFQKDRQVLSELDPSFQSAMEFLMNKVNFVSDNIKGELEVASQVGSSHYTFKPIDLEKAQKRFKEIGERGEELIKEYLEKQKEIGNIAQYKWVNKNHESGLPYDFLINDKLFVDVKSTDCNFEQSVFFSGDEIEFASSLSKNEYSVFRVFDMKTETRKLKICKECSRYLNSIQHSITDFKTQVEREKSILQTIKLGVNPINCFTEFGPTIELV